MADLPSPLTVATKRISDLPAATPLTGDELLPAVQAGTTKKVTIGQLVDVVTPLLPEGPEGPEGPQGPAGPTGAGVPSGGSVGEVLKKASNADYDTVWGTVASGSSDHGTLTGLGDDDHPQYHNDARGDARYSLLGHNHAGVYDAAGTAAAAVAAHVGSGGTAHPNATTSVAGFMSASDKTKLDGVAVGATANTTDAALRDRATHTGVQLSSTISDFNEAVDDRVAALLVQGSGITLTYNDAAGTLTVAASGGGSDPWTYIKLGTDFVTSSATAVDVTGLEFTPAANKTYEFEAMLRLRTATTTVGPRPGLAWPTGTTDGVAGIDMTSSATARLLANGNPNAAILAAVGGLPNTTQSYPAWITGNVTMGASPSGTVKVQMASETAGTNVTVKAGSYLKYREI